VPGPGTYNQNSSLSKISFTFKSKTINGDPLILPSRKVPGPGTYEETLKINKMGKYFVSNYRNSLASVFHPAKSKRFSPSKMGELPGPGTYANVDEINKQGLYVESKHGSTKV
jgi:hypothetical protein